MRRRGHGGAETDGEKSERDGQRMAKHEHSSLEFCVTAVQRRCCPIDNARQSACQYSRTELFAVRAVGQAWRLPRQRSAGMFGLNLRRAEGRLVGLELGSVEEPD